MVPISGRANAKEMVHIITYGGQRLPEQWLQEAGDETASYQTVASLEYFSFI